MQLNYLYVLLLEHKTITRNYKILKKITICHLQIFRFLCIVSMTVCMYISSSSSGRFILKAGGPFDLLQLFLLRSIHPENKIKNADIEFIY